MHTSFYRYHGDIYSCRKHYQTAFYYSQIMSMGASRPWPEILSVINGGVPAQLMDPEALIEFFQPLEQWLRVQNGREGLEGWDTTGLETGRRRLHYDVDPRHL
jgi:peptidyl-dipeptidase A